MSESRILHIRESIAVARKIESEKHTLERYLVSKIPMLHRAIALPEENPESALLEFVTRYIEHVPDFIEALTALTKEAGIYEYTQSFLTIAEDYFIRPPELVGEHSGLHQLIDEAYLAHRLLEEVNDRVMMACGMPLAPMDMTLSNLVIHELLGDEFANQLDLAVHYSIEALFQTDNFFNEESFKNYIAKFRKAGWETTIKDWPCLAGDSAIRLNMSDDYAGAAVH
ncbi:hypothetical protein [Saccharophagus degradans]|uniref:Uncharacterized protein n=1 Tax=Saccharophagus degradans (strain 2-40 / ATCC 43961 / DSM 17024) TaxID=203122 RepID=Q21PT2_SACD2|nr:hypothetical protein [Saccharophagus degradans]ABD79297.1 conserved hypothetical protein [Saccharophagus degradans 2-40]